MSDLPTDYDGIVIGTGLTESIIAAALARVGHRVLHIDREDHYSADWSTFNFRGLQDWINQHKTSVPLKTPEAENISKLLEEEETTIALQIQDETFTNIEETVYVKEKDEEVSDNSNIETGRPATETSKVLPQDESGETEEENQVDASKEQENIGTDENESVKSAECNAETETNKNCESDAESQDRKTTEAKDELTQEDKKATEDSEREWTFEMIKKGWRQFNIDLSPKVLHCSGEMVKLLINSDVAKYCEFKTITRVLTMLDEEIIQVPCSRADVFDCKFVSMIEKRMMMKFLQFCAEYENKPEQYQDYKEKPFDEFLRAQKLSPKIQHYIQHAIAMATPQMTTVEALEATQKFLQSLGRYGNTAFLWPMYGSGELPQCFCRMCAVFGGIYYLQKAPVKLILNKDQEYEGIIDSDGLRLKSKWLIMNSSYASESLLLKTSKNLLSRAVLLISHSLLKDWTEHISLLHLPVSEVNPEPVTLFELSYVSHACPKTLYVVHLTMPCQRSAKEDLTPVVDKLFRFPQNGSVSSMEDERPCVLWSLFFNMSDHTDVKMSSCSPDNVFITSGAGSQIDCDHCVTAARSIFEKICPEEEFLPKAPNPEDIIYYDENGELGTADPTEEKLEVEADQGNGDELKNEVEKTENENEENCDEKSTDKQYSAEVDMPDEGVKCETNDDKSKDKSMTKQSSD